MSRVVVVGSLACDFVMRVPRRPQKGETVIGTAFSTFVGGKGNNQALACARAGGDVTMIGRIGADRFGDMILDKLDEARVDREHVVRDAEAGTGIADIQVDDRGDNFICVAPQANARLSPADIEAAAPAIRGARVLLLQLEIPYETAIAAAQLAKFAGVTVVLNPAPAPSDGSLPRALLTNVDLIVPNQLEAQTLTGRAADDVSGAHEAARHLQARGVATVVLTMGEVGALLLEPSGTLSMTPAFEVAVVDTTAAGDAFCGALAAALAGGEPLAIAMPWACAAGALACTRLGAEPSLPSREEIQRLIQARTH